MRTDRAMYKNCITLTATAVLLLGATACTDLTTAPTSTVSSENIFNDPASYRAFAAKLYAGLSVSGQEGPAGEPDIEGIDEGFSQYVRGLWQLQTLPTDEAVIGWGDDSLPEMNTMEWGAANRFTTAFYYRIFYQATLANEFLRETTDAVLTQRGVSQSLRNEIQRYRAEARFLRALSYWHGLDLFGEIPLIRETDPLGTRPSQNSRAELFDFIAQELNEIRPALPGIGQAAYGRADQGAVLMLLAKLYMNAEVYGVGARWGDALAAVGDVISSGAYQLAPTYLRNFLADNHTSPEIIFPVTFDGLRTRTWGGTTFLIHAAVGGNMNPQSYGVGGGWWGLRTTPQLVGLFPGGAGGPDTRSSIFFTDGQTLQVSSISEFTNGYGVPKYRNVTSTGAQGSNSQFPDTDYPMFRLADAYLMYAEAHLRGGGGTLAQAVEYVNRIRERAYGNASGNIAGNQLTLDFVLNERARELFWEGHRRTDLLRYGLFTTGGYLWAWKGGAQQGQAVEPCRALYPIPAIELISNPNLRQNHPECYGGA
jgi:starch-binding outer membrane protein, SusD/RagB family